MEIIYDVAIVGYGPSGAVAAALLGQAGLNVFVCDRQQDIYDKPRAIALDHEILRVFQHIGILDQIASVIEPFTDSEYYGVDGQLIKCMTTVAPPYPLGHPPSVVFTQPPLERALRARVAQFDNVAVLLGAELFALEQNNDSASLLLSLGDGSECEIKARYVIGCDGASSKVRSLSGLPLLDLGFDEPWLVVDVLVNDGGRAKLPHVSVQYCEPDRPCTYVIGPKNHRRWEISLKDGEDPAQMATPEQVWPLLERWITPDDAILWRQASYRFHALVAEQWRAGRIFIAGDAAHQQPPFLGQGLCQGVRDVTNLSWKLAAVLAGRAGEHLLDSYGVERGQHVTQLTGRIKAIGAVICERDPGKARARDAALLAACHGIVQGTPRQEIQPALQCALQRCSLAGLMAKPAHAANGTLFPQPWIRRGTERVPLDSITGTGWRLVFSASALWVKSLAIDPEILRRSQLCIVSISTEAAEGSLQEAEGVLAAWYEKNTCLAALVRPDHYVYSVACTADEVLNLLNHLEKILAE